MKWSQAEHADDVIDAAVALASFAAGSPALSVRPTVRRELLRIYVLPLVTQGTLPAKGKTRYVSVGAASATGDERLEHEHVYTRSFLTDLVLANPHPDSVRWILTNLAVAATVTRSEHTQLTAVPKTIQGWARYAEAGITVYDLVTGLPVAQDMRVPHWIHQPGRPVPERLQFPTDALDQFLETAELRELLDPESTELPGARDWLMRQAEAFECISAVSRAAGRSFDSLEDAKEQLFAHASGGGFGIRDWMQDAVLRLLVPVNNNS